MTLFRSKLWQRRVAASFVACWALSAWAQVCSTPGKDGVGAPRLVPDQQNLAIDDNGATRGGNFRGAHVAQLSVASPRGARAEVHVLPSTGVVKVKFTAPSQPPVTNRQLMASAAGGACVY